MPAEPSKDKEHIFPETELLKIREPKSFKDRLMNVYYDSLPLFNVNVAWFLLSLPIVSVLPALGGLYYAVLNYNQNKNANWNIFWEGIKKHWLLSLKWAVVVLFGNLLITLNIWFSLNIDTTWSIYTLLFGLMLGIFWISINQFSFPILLLQKEKKIFLAIRNAYVIVLRRPWDAIKVILLNLLITIVSLLIPPFWIFITMSLIVHIQTRSVLKAVKRIQSQDDDPDTNISES